jgi:hypothetical protein
MPINNLIQIRRGTSTEWANQNPILSSGEPGFDISNNILKIGDGVHSWDELSTLSSQTFRGSFLLNTPTSSFNVNGGYSIGALDVFMNGIKLSPSGDYVANDGESFTLSEIAPSGSLIEYLALSPGLSISTNSIADFNSSVSGLLPVTNIVSANNITINNSSGIFTIGNSGLVNSNISGIVGATNINNIVKMSEADYNNLETKDPNTVYFIV